jgi:hypothetical protein
MAPTESVDSNHFSTGAPRVVFIMGTARSGSTLLGTLLGEADDVFFAGELCDWAYLDGTSTVPRSRPFWEKVRSRIGPLPRRSSSYKRLFEHPAGMVSQISQRRLRQDYERLTFNVIKAVAEESGCSIIVDSSHFPRRAQVLRRLLGPEQVRLVFLVRRPSSVAQSLRKTGKKGFVQGNFYMAVVGVMAWLTYLTHPRRHRAIVSYEQMVRAPLEVGRVALGQPLHGVDPEHMAPPLILIGNRFVKNADEVTFNRTNQPQAPSPLERISDVIQWPLLLAERAARSRPCDSLDTVRSQSKPD